MILPKQDFELLFQLHHSLFVFANVQFQIVENIDTINKFMKLDMIDKVKVRNSIYENIDILKDFYKENPFNFAERDLKIVLDWKYFIKDRFIAFKQMKKYCTFLHDQGAESKVYGVLGLTESLDEKIDRFPKLIETVLLPFKNYIIHDGYFSQYGIYWGSNIRTAMKEEYNKAVAKYGIIEQLPFKPPAQHDMLVGQLQYYMKSEKNIAFYADEIDLLIGNNPDLQEIYHHEFAKVSFKKYKKRLKELGITTGWIAMLDDMIIASGITEEKLKATVNDMIAEHMQMNVIYFKL
ncbi:hypothetical protein JW960_17750 [candidate division KSB1 bacterium]|nr:hypothetical protein [candidate division KSB1 bacterium]